MPYCSPSARPRVPDGACHNCGAVAVPFGCFCAACYGGVFDPDGLPMVPGDPGDPYRSFNAEWAATQADMKMPANVAFTIAENAHDLAHCRWLKDLD